MSDPAIYEGVWSNYKRPGVLGLILTLSPRWAAALSVGLVIWLGIFASKFWDILNSSSISFRLQITREMATIINSKHSFGIRIVTLPERGRLSSSLGDGSVDFGSEEQFLGPF